jgi:hypothetical protein
MLDSLLVALTIISSCGIPKGNETSRGKSTLLTLLTLLELLELELELEVLILGKQGVG